MKVKSTGLGKTQLSAHFDGFTAKEGGENSAVLIITSTEPVHWHIECDLGGNDLRQFAAQVLHPSMIWHLVKLLARGGEARGFVMEKEGGRRSRKERVSRTADVKADVTAAAPETATIQTSPDDKVVAAAAKTVAAGTLAAPTTSAQSAASVHSAAPTQIAGRFAEPTVAPRADEKSASSDSRGRQERENRRAERRREREEAAQQYATAK